MNFEGLSRRGTKKIGVIGACCGAGPLRSVCVLACRAYSFSPPPPPTTHRPHSPEKWFASYLQMQLGRRSPLQPAQAPTYARSPPPPMYAEQYYQRHEALVVPPSPPPRSSRLQVEDSPRLRRGFVDATRRSLGAGETRCVIASPNLPRR